MKNYFIYLKGSFHQIPLLLKSKFLNLSHPVIIATDVYETLAYFQILILLPYNLISNKN